MMQLHAYLDETGHSKDERQRFNGMAGLIATVDYWEQYDRKWREALKDYKIPFFHMKDFASCRGVFEGWSEPKRRKLYGKLMRIIATAYALPFGSIIPMEIFRRFSKEQQSYFGDPYYFNFITCVVAAADLMSPMPAEEELDVVFSEQVEFRSIARKLYELAQEGHPFGRKLKQPGFADMREIVPLQGADIVAYEFYKECERRQYRPDSEPRWGFKELVRICRLSAEGFFPLIIHDETTLGMHVRHGEEERARASRSGA
jgi:hypothetical protein